MLETLTAADGHAFDCWMQPAEGPPRGGLVILQEIFGVTDLLLGVARRYASQGLSVAIPALCDRQTRGAVIAFEQAASVTDAMTDIQAAVDAVAAKGGKVAVMGFCWRSICAAECA